MSRSCDDGSQVTSFVNSGDGGTYADENVLEYTYDNDGQLTGATEQSGQSPNQSNSLSDSYDPNGNAISIDGASTSVGQGNTQLFDGTYYDTYDANGNLLEQANSTSEIFYTYDNRNRLTEVLDYVLSGDDWKNTTEIDYTYDVFNNLIGRAVTNYESDGVTIASQTATRNVFDGGNMALSFDANGNLTDRYLWGPAVDQILADENFTPSGTNTLPSSPGNTLWSLADNEGSLRDVVNDAGALQEHIAYSPFGAQTSEPTDPGDITFAFGYTGTYTDAITTFQYHSEPSTVYAGRWYDPTSQEWISQDPTGLMYGSNPCSYAGDGPTDAVDPSGLEWRLTRSDFGKARLQVSNSSADDTVSALAKMRNLTPSEFEKWLVPVGHSKLPGGATQPIGTACQKFTIPNTVVEYIMSSSWPTHSLAITWCEITARVLAGRFQFNGYKLVEVSNGTFGSFQTNFQDPDVAAFFFGGHGTEDSQNHTKSLTLTDGWLEPLITAQPYQVHRPFGLAFLGLFACYSANNAGAGNGYWSQFVSTSGTFEGGDGLVYIWSTFSSWTGSTAPTPPAAPAPPAPPTPNPHTVFPNIPPGFL